MWTNQEGQVFIIPRHRRKRILKSLWTSGFRNLAEEFYYGSWKDAIDHALGHIFKTGRRNGSLRHSDGRLFPLFTSYSGETTFSFVTIPMGRNRFSVVAVRATEKPEADHIESPVTKRNIGFIKGYLQGDSPVPISQLDRIVLDNHGQKNVGGSGVGNPKSTVDIAYLTQGPSGTQQRVNVELDSTAMLNRNMRPGRTAQDSDFQRHMDERIKADANAHGYFLLQDRRGRLVGGYHYDPNIPGNQKLIPLRPDELAGRGRDKFSFLPSVIKSNDQDPGYRAPKNRLSGVNRNNFQTTVALPPHLRDMLGKPAPAPARPSAPPRRPTPAGRASRSRESEWTELETENEVLSTLGETLNELEFEINPYAANAPRQCACQTCAHA